MSIAIFMVIVAVIVAAALLVMFTIIAIQNQEPALSTSQFHWDALADEELQSYLPNQKIAAIKRYRELTGVGLKDAKQTIDYIIANPDSLEKAKHDSLKGAVSRLADTGGAGIRDLLEEGRIEEAVRVYADFMGVDEYTARDAIEQMRMQGSN